MGRNIALLRTKVFSLLDTKDHDLLTAGVSSTETQTEVIGKGIVRGMGWRCGRHWEGGRVVVY